MVGLDRWPYEAEVANGHISIEKLHHDISLNQNSCRRKAHSNPVLLGMGSNESLAHAMHVKVSAERDPWYE